MTWSLPEPMLTVAVGSPDVPAGWAAEAKWDGYRAQLAVHTGGRVLLRSRRRHGHDGRVPRDPGGGLAQLPADTGPDGELVVWERDRLAFERLQQQLARHGQLPFRRHRSGRRTSWPSTWSTEATT